MLQRASGPSRGLGHDESPEEGLLAYPCSSTLAVLNLVPEDSSILSVVLLQFVMCS